MHSIVGLPRLFFNTVFDAWSCSLCAFSSHLDPPSTFVFPLCVRSSHHSTLAPPFHRSFTPSTPPTLAQPTSPTSLPVELPALSPTHQMDEQSIPERLLRRFYSGSVASVTTPPQSTLFFVNSRTLMGCTDLPSTLLGGSVHPSSVLSVR